MNVKERVLIAVVIFDERSVWTPQDTAVEMEELVKTCGAQVVEKVLCRAIPPTAATLIGSGKVKEIAEVCAFQKIDTVIVSFDLKGSQQRNLEDAFKVKTIDRTQLILDIFARNARTPEAKMQVELAQLEYLLPRLTGKGVEMSRLGGGIGTMGPGETKLEVDRRRISDRVSKLKKDLKLVTLDRQLKRKKRKDNAVPAISIVGYTNAGKSTLLSALTNAGQKTHDGLFTTLDSLSRQFFLPNHQKAIASDTIGFMHALPHHLIESFKTTLEEVSQADLLLHVLDISHPNALNFYQSVNEVLSEIDVAGKPVIVVLNKIDKITEPGLLDQLKKHFDNPVCISGLLGQNLNELLGRIEEVFSEDFVEIDVRLPLNRMDLVNLAHKEGKVKEVKYLPDAIFLSAVLPAKISYGFSAAALPAPP